MVFVLIIVACWQEAEANVDEKVNSFADTLIVEMEASVYGLQVLNLVT